MKWFILTFLFQLLQFNKYSARNQLSPHDLILQRKVNFFFRNKYFSSERLWSEFYLLLRRQQDAKQGYFPWPPTRPSSSSILQINRFSVKLYHNNFYSIQIEFSSSRILSRAAWSFFYALKYPSFSPGRHKGGVTCWQSNGSDLQVQE